jgi:hypothetical protein
MSKPFPVFKTAYTSPLYCFAGAGLQRRLSSRSISSADRQRSPQARSKYFSPRRRRIGAGTVDGSGRRIRQ